MTAFISIPKINKGGLFYGYCKETPSGQWRTLAYSHTETIDGKQKRIYESFTAPTKKEAEYMAAEFMLNKSVFILAIYIY